MAIGNENYHNKMPSNCSPNIRRKRKSSDRMLNPPPSNLRMDLPILD